MNPLTQRYFADVAARGAVGSPMMRKMYYREIKFTASNDVSNQVCAYVEKQVAASGIKDITISIKGRWY